MATQVTTGLLANDAVTDAKLSDTITATTQSASDNSTKVATTAYVTTAIANLADSAPDTLNTLNELAAALGDDANFSTTITNSIATKAPLASPSLTGTVTITGASSAYNTLQLTSNSTGHGTIVNLGDTSDADYGSITQFASSAGEGGRMRFIAGTTETMNLRGGKVGIGTTNPANNLHIHTDSGDEGLTIKSTGNTSNAIIFDANRSGAGSSIGEIQNKWNGTTTSMIASATGTDTTNKDDGELVFYTASAGSLVERMRVKNNGGVSLTGNHQFNFRANGASNPGNGADIVFDTVKQGNAAGCYNTSTGAYEAAIAGWYMFSVGVRYDQISGTGYVRPQIRFLANGSSTWVYPHTGGWVDPIHGSDLGTGYYLNVTYTVPLYMNVGDQVRVHNNGNMTNSVNHDESHFGCIFMG